MSKNIIAIDRIPYFQNEEINLAQLATTKLGIRPKKDIRIPELLIIKKVITRVVRVEAISTGNPGGH